MSWTDCPTCGAGACIGPRETCTRVPEAALSPANRKLFALIPEHDVGMKTRVVDLARLGFDRLNALLDSARAEGRLQGRAEKEAELGCSIGVGDGSGSLFVYGSHEAVMRVRELILDAGARSRAAVVAEGERDAWRAAYNDLWWRHVGEPLLVKITGASDA